jgi:hypothetical protein
MALPTNYYSIAQWLVDRLKLLQTVAIDPHSPATRIRWVAALADVERAAEESHNAPAIFVIPLGRSRPQYQSEKSATCSQVTQRWLIVIAIRDSHLANESAYTLADGGHYISAVINHLQGWRPTPTPSPAPTYRGDWTELKWVDEFEPIFRSEEGDRGGLALFGLVFETTLFLRHGAPG